MFVGFALANEFDRTVYQSKQGVVFAHADVFAGMDSGAALTHDDAASVNGLSTVNFPILDRCGWYRRLFYVPF